MLRFVLVILNYTKRDLKIKLSNSKNQIKPPLYLLKNDILPLKYYFFFAVF